MAAVRYVDVDNATGVEDGLSWATAFRAIQTAIDAVYSGGGGEAWVAEGTYGEQRSFLVTEQLYDLTIDVGSLALKPGVDVYGGFAGNETAIDQRDWRAHSTVIDGSRSRAGTSAYHVVFSADNCVLDGFTVTGGNASHSLRDSGGGMFVRGTSPTVRNCLFVGNSADDVGGAIAVAERSARFVDCGFESNFATLSGGAVTTGTGAAFERCFFRYNRSDWGGAVFVHGGTEFKDCIFAENRSNRDGGAAVMSSWPNLPRFVNCAFVNNESMGGQGGAVFDAGSVSAFDNCSFVGNHTGTMGGAIAYGATHSALVNCVFLANEALAAGGAIYGEGELEEECTGSKDVVLSVTNCTFVGNVAAAPGGAITLHTAYSLQVRNSILWDNWPDEINPFENSCGYPTKDITFSLIAGGYEGTGNLDTDPLFVDPENGDLRLRAESPCIDTATAEGAPETDIRGVTRPQGAGFDMGAYEYLSSDTGDVNADKSVDAVDVQLVINGALGLDTRAALDLDGNGPIDAIDVQMVINAALGVG
ncbi:MAG: hypothetical protein HY706_01915 [Candidatus Hydrogenedentes bacterium]|nr:hypothetical protein [Candidatus Hydrogenedentota bacterium]